VIVAACAPGSGLDGLDVCENPTGDESTRHSRHRIDVRVRTVAARAGCLALHVKSFRPDALVPL
jgi:hypothetical protein